MLSLCFAIIVVVMFHMLCIGLQGEYLQLIWSKLSHKKAQHRPGGNIDLLSQNITAVISEDWSNFRIIMEEMVLDNVINLM